MNSDSSRKATALESLVETYTDSDDELEAEPQDNTTPLSAEDEVQSTESAAQGAVSLVSYGLEDDDGASGSSEDEQPEESEDGESSKATRPRPESPVSFHRRLKNLPVDEIVLPPEPPGRCAPALQQKIARLYERKVRKGVDMNATIQMRKDFRNPSMYEKLVSFCGIDELGTNYPPELYDPSSWGPESDYEEVSRRQKEEMEKRQREKKPKVEFFRGVSKVPKPTKSKWDVVHREPFQGIPRPSATTTAALGAPIAIAGTSKSTVISAFGALSKKPPTDTKH
ncbi:SAP30-binding protein-like [Amblyomma americanum]